MELLLLLGPAILFCLAAVWTLGCVVCGWAAGQKGRSPMKWFLAAVVVSPLIALLALIAIPNIE
jgi:hypothetical protein